MGKIVANEPCPSCRSVGRDSTGNHLLTFEDGGKHCLRCKLVVNKYGTVLNQGKFNSIEEAQAAVNPRDDDDSRVSNSSTDRPEQSITFNNTPTENHSSHTSSFNPLTDLPAGYSDREISKETMEKYNTRFAFDEADASISKHFYPVTIKGGKEIYTWKCRRKADKKFFTLDKIPKSLKVDLYGLQAYPKRKGMNLVITEGELDAQSAWEMLKDEVVDLMVLSLPFGANIPKAIGDNLELISDQDSVVLCYDQDDAGYKAEEETWKLVNNVKVMKFSSKDPNQMLQDKKQVEFCNAYHHADVFRPRVYATIKDMDLKATVSPVKIGLTYPWEALNKITYGIHLNQVVGIGAAPGAGKTTLVRGIQQQLMYHHKEKIGIFSLEEKPEWTSRLIVGYILNKPIHIPGTIYNEAEAQKVLKSLEGKAHFYEHKYYQGQWEEIENHIRYLHIAEGIRFFFIDPLSALVSHLTPSEANKYLGEAMYKLSKLVQQLDITVFHVNHLNTSSDGKSHEAGARVYSSQFTGSRAQWRYSHALFGAERDQLATDGSEEEMIIRFLKDRAFGNTGRTAKLRYNRSTGRLEDLKVKF